ncbi:MAG TPA: hypothetical protein VNW28_03140 [Chthoniobacterales bacterium]|jgi:hypothetical protein|nr:hypothetical protein [Chthoniobacterales bacterium]
MLTEIDRLTAIREARPAESLFAEKDWLLSPEAFAIEEKHRADLERLGHQLFVFQRACNQLYQQSVKGRQPGWVARYLDIGKPAELIEFSRQKEFREVLPRVIRPDLVLTDEGWTIAETDSVPGGIGLTAWLNQTYASLGSEVVGGADGMLDGFATVLPRGGDIVISQESATYRPEMEWLVRQLHARFPERSWKVEAAENYQPQTGRDVYRFFELFDLPNLPGITRLIEAAGRGELTVTPPFKPYLEEKTWFALFWLQPLRDFWRRELGDKYFRTLQKIIPYTWILDPTPLPQHAVIPRLEIQDWREAGKFSQKERDLLLKVSGFSPLGWGSRGVVLGADLPHAEWEQGIADALTNFEREPTIMQRFHKGRLFDQPYWDTETSELKTMHGRVRLCPYYFVEAEGVSLRGALATICPADKKLLHGMSDAILVPSRFTSLA